MTFDEAKTVGKVALCGLPGGAQLRYDPSEDSIRQLPYPGMPRQWREASNYKDHVPTQGWTHYRGCECPLCAAAADQDAKQAKDAEREGEPERISA
jgi:hypothetical protein